MPRRRSPNGKRGFGPSRHQLRSEPSWSIFLSTRETIHGQLRHPNSFLFRLSRKNFPSERIKPTCFGWSIRCPKNRIPQRWFFSCANCEFKRAADIPPNLFEFHAFSALSTLGSYRRQSSIPKQQQAPGTRYAHMQMHFATFYSGRT